MKRLLALSLALVFVFSLAACAAGGDTPAPQETEAAAPVDTDGGDGEQSAEPAQAGGSFTVGVTCYSTSTVFARNARAAVQRKIEEMGGTYIDNVADDIVGRADAIDTFVAQGVDAIILIVGDVTECEANIAAAKAKGIVVGSCDAGFVDGVDIYTSSDNYAIGETVVDALVERMGGAGDIVQIYNDVGSMDRRRKGGAADVIDQNDGISIEWGIVYAWPDYFPDVKAKMEALIQSDGQNIGGIFATFDGVGLAALQAIREAGLEEQIPIVGVDGDPEALNEIADPDSAFYATVIQSWDDCANICVNEVFNKLGGGELSTNQILVPGILVTKENVEEIKGQYPELFEE